MRIVKHDIINSDMQKTSSDGPIIIIDMHAYILYRYVYNCCLELLIKKLIKIELVKIMSITIIIITIIIIINYKSDDNDIRNINRH